MRLSILLSLSLFLSVSVYGQNIISPKLSPRTMKYVHDLKKTGVSLQPGYVYNRGADGVVYVSALVKVEDEKAADMSLNAMAANVGTRAGRIWTVKVPVNRMNDFVHTAGIRYIQLDEPVRPSLDKARKTTRVDSVHGGYDLPMAYSGKDVVVGVIDFGFDYNHPTFYDTTHTTYRIKQVWQMNGTAAPPSGYSYGKEITDAAAIRAEGTDDPKQNHGTSVGGMAAGSGFGSSATSSLRFRGMAYDADIVMVGVRRDSIGGQWIEGSFSDFLDGVKYIFDYATAVGKPCVVNISWGSQSGSHDGTSLFNEACNTLSGPGKIIVMSAGNDGQDKIHLSKTFTAADTAIHTFLTFNPTTYQRTWIDVWGQPGKTFCTRVTLYDGAGVAGNTTEFHCIDDAVTDTFLISSNGLDTCYVQFITSSAEDNGKPRITVNMFNKSTDTIGFSVMGVDGKIDMWNEYYYYGFPYKFKSEFDALGYSWAETGNTVSTVSDMGSATSVLLVGAYASKVGFTDINGNNWSYSGYVLANRLVPFSSRGPMIDGRIKPDITAPGLTIATAMSSYDTSHTETGSNSTGVIAKYTDAATSRDYYYCEFSGTSASAPAASGIVALLLQANPTLTPDHLKTILFETAITDVFTGVLPAAGNNDWGHGKINAYKAMKRVVQEVGIYNYQGKKPDVVVFPNPTDGVFAIDYAATNNEPVNVSVYNISGVMVYAKLWQVGIGTNRLNVALPNMAGGTYVVRLTTTEGAASVVVTVK